MKLPNGYGGIVNLGKNRRKPWAVRITETWLDNKQMYRYISYHTTKKEATKALADYQINPVPPKSKVTFKELYKEWKETKDFTDISHQMQDCYEAAYKHLLPLYNTKFTDLRTSHYQKVIDEATKKDGTSLSRSSTQKIRGLISRLYVYAMANDLSNKNYSQFIRLDREIKKEKEIFSDTEIQKLFKNDNIPYADTILILIYSGMRIGELLALTKFSIDLKANTITGGLKTDAGKDRTIPIHPKILKYIKKWYNTCPNEHLIYKDEGKKITPKYYRETFYYPILEKLNINKKTPHSTRHTCATMLAKSGADINAIKKILGHTDYAFTADAYTHEDVGFLAKEMDKI